MSTTDSFGARATFNYDADGNRTQRVVDPYAGTVALAGGVQTGATRVAAVDGDGEAVTDSSTGVWQSTTNLVPNGGFEANTATWTAAQGTETLARSTLHQFGSHSLRVTTPGTVSNEGAGVFGQQIAISAGSTYTLSAWVWAPNGQSLWLRGTTYNSSGTSLTTNSQTFTGSGGFQRVVLMFVADTGASSVNVRVATAVAEATSFEVDGVQLEALPIATPYVDTSGQTATRATGSAALPASLLDETQGWVAMRVRPAYGSATPPTAGNRYLFGWSDNSSNELYAYISTTGRFGVKRLAGSGGGGLTAPATTYAAGSPLDVVVAWTATQVEVSVNGTAFSTVANTSIPTLSASSFYLGGLSAGSAFDGDVVWAAVGTGTLSNTDVAALGAIGDRDPVKADLPSTATATEVWGAEQQITQYSYDNDDELSSEIDAAGKSYSLYYDSRGDLRGTEYPNGTFSWTDTDSLGETTDVYNRHGTINGSMSAAPADSIGNPIADYDYTYTVDGQKATEQLDGGTPTQYTYDDLGRLTDASGLSNGHCLQYSYDLDSNRTSEDDWSNGCGLGSNETTYNYDPSNPNTPGVDQLTSTISTGGTSNYTYTPDGQVSGYGTNTISWDGWGRTTGGTYNGSAVTYAYDPLGALRKRTTSSKNTYYLLGDLIEQYGSGAVQNTYIDGPSGDLADYPGPISDGEASYLYYNGHGDLAAAADASGSRIGDVEAYDPFGVPLASQPANSTLHLFTGRWDKQYDTTSSLVLMGARPYDPALGRFLAVDPVDGGSLNNYDYAGQDPLNKFDLNGRYCSPAELAAWLSPSGNSPFNDCANMYADYKACEKAAAGMRITDNTRNEGCYAYAAGRYEKKYKHSPIRPKEPWPKWLTKCLVGSVGGGALSYSAAGAARWAGYAADVDPVTALITFAGGCALGEISP